MRILELADVIVMLRSDVDRVGGQVAWAKKAGVDRAIVSKVLNGHRPPNKAIIDALSLRMVFVAHSKPPQSKRRSILLRSLQKQSLKVSALAE